MNGIDSKKVIYLMVDRYKKKHQDINSMKKFIKCLGTMR